jgi:hypothetical protein
MARCLVLRCWTGILLAGDEKLEASTGDIVVVGGETPHMFKNVGSERLDISASTHPHGSSCKTWKWHCSSSASDVRPLARPTCCRPDR